MSREPSDDLPWWCQPLWPWFGPPWYEQVEDPEAYLAAYWCALHLSAAELAELLAGLAALYVLPTMIAVIRHVENIGLVVFLNCFPIAWPAALVAACMLPRKAT
jgi:hypothetical protein